MADVLSALKSVLEDPSEENIQNLVDAAGSADVEACRKAAWSQPADPQAAAALFAALVRDHGLRSREVADTAKALASRVPRDGSGDDVLLLAGRVLFRATDDPKVAEPIFRRIRRTRPTDPAVLDFYRTLFGGEGQVPQLVQILVQARRKSEDRDTRLALAREIASLSEGPLASPERAIEIWRAVLREDGAPDEAFDELERLYRTHEKWSPLVELLKDRAERIEDVDRRRSLLLEVANLYRERLGMEAMALSTLQRVLEIDPNHEPTLAALAQTYADQQRWNDLLAIYERRLEAAEAAGERERIVDRLWDIARLWMEALHNPQRAIEPLRRILELAPDHADARSALASIFEERKDWRALIALLREGLDDLDEAEARGRRLELARLAEARLGDRGEAIAAWNEVLTHHGDEPEALDALLRAYEREGRWVGVAEMLRRKLRAVEGTEAAIPLLEQLGATTADRLHDHATAIEIHRELLRLAPGHDRALRALRDAYVAAEAWDELVDLYDSQGRLADVVEILHSAADRIADVERRVALYRRVAEISRDRLGQPERGQRALERILAISPDALDVARELLPIYELQGNWARVLSTYEALLGGAETDDERLELYEAMQDVAADKIGSASLTLGFAAAAYALRPQDPEIRGRLERAAEAADGWDELTRRFEERLAAEDVQDDERVDLLRKLAEIALHRLFKPDDAQRYYRRILDVAPGDEEAMAALEEIYRSTRRWEDLAEVRRLRIAATTDDEERLALLRELARLERDRLGDLETAAETFARIRELAPDDTGALEDHANLLRRLGRLESLADALSALLDRTEATHRKVEILLELGDLWAGKLDAPDRALGAFLEVLELSPAHEGAVARLEALREARPEMALPVAQGLLPVYRRLGRREKEAAALAVVVDAEADPERRLDRLGDLAGIFEEIEERRPDAFRIRLERFDARPGDWDNRQSLLQLGRELGRVDDVAAAYERATRTLQEARAALEAEGKPVPREQELLRRDLLLELAGVLRRDLGRTADAEAVYRSVLDIEETHEGAYKALRELLEARGASAELFDLLRRRADAIFHPGEQRALLETMIDLARDALSDLDRAIATAQELVDLAPDDVDAIARLCGLLEEAGDAADRYELEELLGRWADLVDDPARRRDLQIRRAALRMEHLQDAFGAVDLLGQVVADDPTNAEARSMLEALLDVADVQMSVASLLEPIYESAQDAAGRIRLLRVKKAQAEARGDVDEAVGRLLAIADIEERDLADFDAALADTRAAYLLDPTREDTLERLERLGFELGRVRDVVETWREALEGPALSDRTLRVDRVLRLAQVLDLRLGDAAGARDAYVELLALEPADVRVARQAVEALCRLHAEAGDMIAWIEAKRAFLGFLDAPEDKVAHLHEIARVQIEQLHDRVGAALTWAEILDLDPTDEAALSALERLFEEEGEWARLDEVLQHRISVSTLPRNTAELWKRLGDLRRERLGDLEGATAAYQSILDLRARRELAVYALERLVELFEAQERWADVEDALRRLVNLSSDDATRIEYSLRTAQVLAKHLGRNADALDILKRVLDLAPTDARARGMVSAFLEDEDLRERAIRILTPLYEAEQNWPALLAIEELQAKMQPSGRRRLAALLKVAKTHEERLQDPERAFAVLCAAMREAADQPELAEVLGEVERLGADPERAERLLEAYTQTVDHILDADLQRRVLRSMGSVALDRLGRLDEARAAYARVFDADPRDDVAFGALRQILERQGDHAALADLLRTRAAHVDDASDRDALLLEAADLLRDALDDPEEAIAVLESLSSDARLRPDVEERLERLYERTERYRDLAGHLAGKLGRLSGADAVDTHIRLGRLHGQRLGDPEEGVRHLAAALRLDPQRTVAAEDIDRYLEDPNMRLRVAEMLEPVFTSIQDWNRLLKVYEVRLAETTEPSARRALLLRIARMEEEQIEDLDRAFSSYVRLFQEEPTDVAVRDHLRRLAGVLGQLEGLADIFCEVLEGPAAMDDRPEILAVAREAAQIIERIGTGLGRAADLYARIHRARPGDADAFGDLERTLTAAERWEDLRALYLEAADAAAEPRDEASMLERAARVCLDVLDDLDGAVAAYERIVLADPEDEKARRQLESLYERTGRHTERADLLRDTLDRATAPHERAALYERLAQVLDGALGDPDGALDVLAAWLSEQPDDEGPVAALEALAKARTGLRVTVAELLAPVYETQGRIDRLVELAKWRLAATEDPVGRHEILREIAALELRGEGGEEAAFRTLTRALAEPGEPGVYEALDAEVERIAERLGRTVALAEARAAASRAEPLADDVERRRDLLVAAARGFAAADDPARAAEALDEALELVPDDAEALELLDAALDRLGHHERLKTVLEHRIERSLDDMERLELLRRLGRLLEDVLVQPEAAERVWREVVEIDVADEEALSRLGRAYERSGSSEELAEVLRRRIEAAADPATRRDLRWQLAGLLREAIKDRAAEVEVLRDMVVDDPGDVEALEALARALAAIGRHAEAVDAIVDRARLAEEPGRRAAFLVDAARMLDEQAGDVYGALERYVEALDTAPEHAGTIDAFVSFAAAHPEVLGEAIGRLRGPLEAAGRWSDLVRLLARRAETAEDPGERYEALAEQARLTIERLDDADGALDAYLHLLKVAPEERRGEVLEHVARLSMRVGSLADLLGRLEAVGEEAGWASSLGRDVAVFAARLAEETAADPERALDLLGHLVETPGATAEVEHLSWAERLAKQVGRDALWESVARRIAEEAPDPADRVGAYLRLADHALEQGRAEAALDHALDAHGVEPSSPQVRTSLERLLAALQNDPPARLLDALEEVYDAAGDDAGIATVLRFRLARAEGFDRLSLLRRLAEVLERSSAPAPDRLEVYGAILAEDPLDEGAVERIATLGSEASLAARAAELLVYATGKAQKEGASPLVAGLAAVERIAEGVGDVDGAREVLAVVEAAEPKHPGVLRWKAALAERAGDTAAMVDAHAALADVLDDPAEQVEALRTAARAASEGLGDPARAAELWRRLLDLEPDDAEADDAHLAALAKAGDVEAYAAALADRIERTADPSARRELRERLAHLYVDKLGRTDDAIAVYEDMLTDDPADPSASAALEVLLRSAERWSDLADLLERRLDVLAEPADRHETLRKLARLAAERRDDPDAAIDWLRRLAAEGGATDESIEWLDRLLVEQERWADLAEELERRAEEARRAGDEPLAARLVTRQAEILARYLDETDRAQALLQDLLEAHPDDVAAIVALAAVYEARGDTGAMRLSLQRAAALDPKGEEGARLYVRLSELATDPSTRIEHLERALALDPGNAAAAAALLELARAREDWPKVAYLLEVLGARERDPARRRALLFERVDLLLQRLDDADAALRLLAAEYEHVQDDVELNRRIADALFVAERFDEAKGMYEWLVAVGRSSPRPPKVLAHDLTRLAQTFERGGDSAQAAALVREAYKVDPTHTETLLVLGRLAEAEEDWDTALRVYRTMLLQNADRTGAVDRGDLYYHLAKAHRALGEVQKAQAMIRRGLDEAPEHEGLKAISAELA